MNIPAHPHQAEVGDAKAEIAESMRSRLHDLTILVGTANGFGEGWADPDKLKALGVEECHATEDDGRAAEEAEERLLEYPLCVEATTTFEIVLRGGPDSRLVVECEHHPESGPEYGYTIRRVLYRYSWTGSAEIELTGENLRVAEEFARRVVPELAE